MRAIVTDYHDSITVESDYAQPTVCKSHEVIVNVEAASINPIDARLAQGDGASLTRFVGGRPVLGRDGCGVVTMIGTKVTSVAVGDKVWFVTINGGTMAEYVLLKDSEITKMPSTLTSVEAASLPFAVMTACACLSSAAINVNNAREKTVLVHGGAGGVGSVVLQILRAWNTKMVVATASRSESLKLIEDLGAQAIDYKSPGVMADLKALGPYDSIIACANSEFIDQSYVLLKSWRFGSFVSLDSPLLNDTRRFTVPLGLIVVGFKFVGTWLKIFLTGGRLLKWAVAQPSQEYLLMAKAMVEKGELVPQVENEIQFEDAPTAIKEILNTRSVGKSVILIVASSEELRDNSTVYISVTLQ